MLSKLHKVSSTLQGQMGKQGEAAAVFEIKDKIEGVLVFMLFSNVNLQRPEKQFDLP